MFNEDVSRPWLLLCRKSTISFFSMKNQGSFIYFIVAGDRFNFPTQLVISYFYFHFEWLSKKTTHALRFNYGNISQISVFDWKADHRLISKSVQAERIPTIVQSRVVWGLQGIFKQVELYIVDSLMFKKDDQYHTASIIIPSDSGETQDK